jgi:hypothetical protein
VDRWLDAIGIRRGVLLALGSAGLAALVVAGVSLHQLGEVAGRRIHADAASSSADLGTLQGMVWRARFEALSAITAVDPVTEQEYDRRFARSVKGITGNVAAYRALTGSPAERAAIGSFTRAWQQFLDARQKQATARLAPAADAASSALESLAVAARQAAKDDQDAAGRTYSRAQAILILIFGAGIAGAHALARLAADGVVGLHKRIMSILRADAKDDPAPVAEPTGGCDVGEMARSVAAAADLMRATVSRLEQVNRRLPLRQAALTQDTEEISWWLRPGSSGSVPSSG